MQDAITGIATIWIVIAVGWLTAHLGLVDHGGRRLMSLLAFNVGTPMLMFALLSTASLDHLFSTTALVSVLAVAATMAVYFAVAPWVFRPGVRGLVIGALASAYTNANNFGLPVALALLGDGTRIAPILLLQVGLLQPLALVILDARNARSAAHRPSPWHYVAIPFKNPITVGILLGLAANVLPVTVPALVSEPVALIGNVAVPLMLLAFGASLRLDPLPGSGPHRAHVWFTVVLKVLVHPLLAWVIGHLVFGLTGPALYAVVVLGALPAAQNVYVVATRYRAAELLARDAVFWTTILSVGTLLAAAALFG
ncbi:AEC family transporter [Propioniciclava soli]|uniref:AEC family transporter n=1 Tax=Propioniciclava soli TaxID=2775081 RepID=UPI001E4403E2